MKNEFIRREMMKESVYLTVVDIERILKGDDRWAHTLIRKRVLELASREPVE